ncbi:LysR family transcriptional regulator [[Mycobacterium] burgundiense]|uniref:LysR family transcriptional regulator n=1 Tax=[Mycobacterium] burgundiense TaxID=3064286 RepID=A0ABN9NTC6_9MYCO|nr:LysR family transcriptional regulator [Mycolicibacterium sp. MU0053]CAJ1510060.1 LysR family transcriptional regulator [Mycolicibacterium sp. MU0053]
MADKHVDLRRIDLNLLVAFEVLVTERSVTRAATRLSVGQSAMSSTLARLRKLLGDPVLVKDGRGLVATPLAESLLTPVRDILGNIEQVLSQRDNFDPTTDARTFSVLVTNYHLTYTFLLPLLARLDVEAPRVRLHIEPTGDDFADRLRRHEVDLLITPRELFPDHRDLPHRALFSDGLVVAVDRDHPEIGDEITYEQFCSLPYIATWMGQHPSLSELQLDHLGVPRNVEVTTEFGIACFLLQGTRLITVVHERLANMVADTANLRLLRPPIEGLQPVTEIMVWTNRTDGDAAHRWLRQRLLELAAEVM